MNLLSISLSICIIICYIIICIIYLLSISDIAIHNRWHNLKACYLGEDKDFGDFLNDLAS